MNRTLTYAVLLLALVSCAKEKPKPRDERIPVSVAVAKQTDVPVQITAIGSVQPMSTVAVRALAGGQLTRVSFREGEDVRRGQLLFTIDPRPYRAALAQAQANLARDQAVLRNAESEAARYGDLVKKDYVTKEEYGRIVAAEARAELAELLFGDGELDVDRLRLVDGHQRRGVVGLDDVAGVDE
ncbi:MAG TPA: biotin/lipoyl-binding protein, partial [Thermoanaerobaculia bacterium]|nr:biotin/lipoyl-binding protein [Thermoanaerobaculia bacterium]